jgi:ETFB lysine methyltransferase
VIRQLLLPDGLCLLTDPDRTPAPILRQRLQEGGFSFRMEFIRAGEPGGNRVKGTLYRIRLPQKVDLCESGPHSVPSE